jgi:hypothetical protein
MGKMCERVGVTTPFTFIVSKEHSAMRFALALSFASVSLITAALTHPMSRTSNRDTIERHLNLELDASLHKRLDRLMQQQNLWTDGNEDRTALTQR